MPHPRNRHPGHYDFAALIQASPALAPFVSPTAYGPLSVDFADPRAVQALNRALLAHYYGLQAWNLPPGYLCPPVPGRADYIHAVADLLSLCNQGRLPRGPTVRGLDIGVGASGIYPIVGVGEYDWSFVGAEVDEAALAGLTQILRANPAFAQAIELRRQPAKHHFFKTIVRPAERFAFSICNPPFHASAQEAKEGSQRKWKNLNHPRASVSSSASSKTSTSTSTFPPVPPLNFGGQAHELWYAGGEVAFLGQMIEESRTYAENILWFTALVSKEASLPALKRALQKTKVAHSQVIAMEQGQKKSRFIAWTFLDRDAQKVWFKNLNSTPQ